VLRLGLRARLPVIDNTPRISICTSWACKVGCLDGSRQIESVVSAAVLLLLLLMMMKELACVCASS